MKNLSLISIALVLLSLLGCAEEAALPKDVDEFHWARRNVDESLTPKPLRGYVTLNESRWEDFGELLPGMVSELSKLSGGTYNSDYFTSGIPGVDPIV